MKIKHLLICLFLGAVSLKAQEVKNPECESAREKAAVDFKNGIRKIYVFGLLPDIKYMRILKDKYDINAVSGGCAVSAELKCYSDGMEELITQERGFGFFQRVRLEVGAKTLPTMTTTTF
jgi:hypothetical protein